MKNLTSITIFFLTTMLTTSNPIPRQLSATEINGRILLHSNLQKTKDLDLQDISNTFYKFIDQNNLKLISQGIGSKLLEYNINTPSHRKLHIKVQKNSDDFKIDLNQKDFNFSKSLNVTQRYYSLNEIQHFLNNSFKSLKGRMMKERKLGKALKLDKDAWMLLFAGVLADEYNVMDSGSETDVYKFVVRKGDEELYNIEVNLGDDDKMIKIYNDGGDEFDMENADHHARYERKIVDSDDEEKLKGYYAETNESILNVINHKNVGDLETLKEDLIGALDGYVLENVFENVYEIKKGDEDLGKLFIYNTEGGFFGVTVKLSDSEFDMMIPHKKSNWSNSLTGLKAQLDTVSDKPQPYNFEEAVTNFLEAFNAACPLGVEFSALTTVDENVLSHMELPSSSDCELESGKIYFEIFKSGYIQFLHFYYDSPFLTTEYMIGLNRDTFEKRSKTVVDELVAQVKEVIEEQQKDGEDVEIKMDDIVKALEETNKGSMCTPNEETQVCHYANGGKSALVDKKDDEASGQHYFRIELFDSINSEKSGDFASNPVYYLQQRNGYDQIELFKAKATDFYGHNDKL